MVVICKAKDWIDIAARSNSFFCFVLFFSPIAFYFGSRVSFGIFPWHKNSVRRSIYRAPSPIWHTSQFLWVSHSAAVPPIGRPCYETHGPSESATPSWYLNQSVCFLWTFKNCRLWAHRSHLGILLCFLFWNSFNISIDPFPVSIPFCFLFSDVWLPVLLSLSRKLCCSMISRYDAALTTPALPIRKCKAKDHPPLGLCIALDIHHLACVITMRMALYVVR